VTTVHIIHLNGFWTVEELEPARVRFSRNFGQPRTQDPTETHWLVCRHLPGPGRVFVNGEAVGRIPEPDHFECQLRSLKPRNVVSLEMETTSSQFSGEVTLEIRKV
jgi:hypothetical protein